ncbi:MULTISPECIES: hypothetical protein [Sphingomonas]|uniref:hypothetical protein n=1 Tax=Sphingomonas TaxID=13687 RepID=UPI000834EE09|nr:MULTISPECIES: hypothetical protein [Sphingomonas]MBY0303321.1 hypothetical protein [Sphingomonas ginsenosidimutans]
MAPALLLAAAMAGASPAGYPAAEVIGALREACPSATAVTTVLKGATPAGWTRAADPAATPVGKLAAMGKEMGGAMLSGTGHIIGDIAVLERTVAGERLYLIPSGIVNGDTMVVGCRLYDPGETRRIPAAEATRILGRKPTSSSDQPMLSKLGWDIGAPDDADSFEIVSVPADSPVVALLTLSGLMMKADWVMPGATDPAPAKGSEEKK